MSNKLYFGDNLEVLRDHIRAESVDLVYLDPPFNSNAGYNVLFKDRGGRPTQAQAEAFCDTWTWGPSAERAFDDVIAANEDVSLVMRGLRSWLRESAMMAYITMMAARLIELRRALKKTGSLYLHCDPTASHYLKLVLDSVFGPKNFRSEIIWKRSSAHSDAKQGRKLHGHIHDVILFYTKSDQWTWNDIYTPYDEAYVNRDYRLIDEAGRRYRRGDLTAAKPGGDVEYAWRVKKPIGARERWTADIDEEYLKPKPDWEYKAVRPYKRRFWAYSKENMKQFAKEGRLRHTFDGMPEYKRYLDEMPGVPLQDLWTDVTPIIAGNQERLGYPTQKPLALMERIISASSNPGDLVLDPFCGCGTTIHAAHKSGRHWLGIDVTHYAITLIEQRLKGFDERAAFAVQGRPASFADAEALAKRDKHQFQWWAAWFVGAQSYREEKRGADRGIDGSALFANGPYGHGRIIISVKGGENVGIGMVRELRAVIEREEAEMGLLITLVAPTQSMIAEATAAGFVKKSAHGRLPRLQIVTVADLFAGTLPHLPPLPEPLVGSRPRVVRNRKPDPRQRELMLTFAGNKTLKVDGAFVDPRYLSFGDQTMAAEDDLQLPLGDAGGKPKRRLAVQ
ncbi:MAG: site-specific DNA-methyltransferase [Rhodospirillales bacterium 24-66-33]|jgi:DNA modification methylase|nr:MAG: site-specific DNA-methyltransferase [Rhodospirillales bacterium 35-66-84]OYZ90682.1 MAG: site-specific DNA-methyltransferase [Rhodospirillales bacterium 24-66-33]OZB21002.1 MAG: site-specific DNA-methyltransferase [Rhodospirillales bacterium 39-66-50]